MGDGSVATATDAREGCLSYSAAGRPAQNEGGKAEVANLLIRALNGLGANWELREDPGRPTDDVDITLVEGQSELLIQVTLAEHQVWPELGRDGKVARRRTPEEAAELVMEAIQHKVKGRQLIPPAQRANLVLALDALDAPINAFPEVVARFRETYQQSVRALGFKAVWLVGPMDDFVHRLDLVTSASCGPFLAHDLETLQG
jgi:hypothetical protein